MLETAPPYLASLAPVIDEVIAPAAVEIDRTGAFPRAALDALGKAGLLGLVSAQEVGGLGEAHRAATLVVEEIAKHCASTALVVCMHYAGAAVVELHHAVGITGVGPGNIHGTCGDSHERLDELLGKLQK